MSETLFDAYLQCGSQQFYNCVYDSVNLCGDVKAGTRICHVLSADTSYYLPLPTLQYLPYYLECGFSDSSYTCNSCSVFMKYDTAFSAIFHRHPVFTGTPNDSDILYNDLYAQYVNFKTGLQHDWLFYQDTMSRTSCAVGGIAGTPKSLSLCLSSQPLNDTTGMIIPVSPCQQAYNRAAMKGAIVYATTQQQLITSFNASYLAKCLADSEFFNVTDTLKEYHYTLYYYDQAGNLVRTIPPKGVTPIYRATWIDSVEKDKKLNIRLAPVHKYWTKYTYNSLNQVNMQKTPDAGTSTFYYDRLGRLALSQNAKQRLVGNEYSYTDYDSLGRITEVGQITAGTAMTDTISKSDSLRNAWFATNTTKRGQITQTVYDTAYGPLAGLELDQQNLRNRVSYTQFIDTAMNLIPSSATYYSYDIHGNVDTLVQDFGFGQTGGVLNMMNTSGNRFKKTVYDYDLISGKVNQVSYQRNLPDAYYHRYDYDAENRITNVYSARDTVMLFLYQSLQEQEAQYTYYNHGPLMNMVLGKMQVQKQDYVYTLQGWLKGINPVMGGTLANGKDTTDLSNYARDVYGFSLHYYNKDYRAIGTASASTTVLNAMGSGATQLYNGNIAAMAVTLSPFGGAGQGTRVYNYKYDQLNRLVAMDAHKGLYPAAGTLGTFTDTLLKDYQERVSYDPNGNILTYNRHGDAARLSMDSMTYSYLDTTNKLDKVVDLATDSPGYGDIHKGQANGNYKYDAIGNLVSDDSDHVSNIKWTVYGKIASLVKSGNTIRYVYDASGNRILKLTPTDTTAYVRDATGNVLSVYTKQAGADTVVRAETDIYGSSRLGMATQHMAPDTLITTLQKNVGLGTKVIFTRGEKLFELNNHLGNVLATVSDRKIEVDSSGDGFVDFYRADVVSASDYYPFGMMMHSRNMHVGTDYRYGFNGKEKDTSISSETAYDYGFRIYNAGLGRFLGVDPLTKKYPMLSPFQFAGNNSIKYIDLDGLEPSNNPSTPGTKEKVAIIAIDLMAAGAAHHDAEENLFTSGSWSMSDDDLKGTYSCGPRGTYVTDTKGDPNNRFNMKVFTGATFNVDESQAKDFKSFLGGSYEAFVVDRLMTNFSSGNGPENYNFPTNGIISSKFLTSDILKSALETFNRGEPVQSTQFGFGAKELAKDFLKTGTLFSITGLVGSGSITIVPNKDGVQVRIFNITSLTSGDIVKNPTNDTNWPKSYVRDQSKTTPYGNISETFNLFLPWTSPLLNTKTK